MAELYSTLSFLSNPIPGMNFVAFADEIIDIRDLPSKKHIQVKSSAPHF